jgi:hypothetical protein
MLPQRTPADGKDKLMTADEAMHRIDALLSHIWMVRTFVKHSEEAEEDEELIEIVRVLYDYCLALGPAWNAKDAAEYLKLARKKIAKLQQATAEFAELQPQVSAHTNFKMAVTSLQTAVSEIAQILAAAPAA